MKRIVAVLLAATLLAGLLLGWFLVIKNPVRELINTMPLRYKITQMLMMSFLQWDDDPADDIAPKAVTALNDEIRAIVEEYRFGSVIFFADNLEETRQAFELTRDLQNTITRAGGLPMFISADQEGGTVYRLKTGTPTPGNMALGAAGEMEYADYSGRIIGRELSVLGINTALAPVVDVNNNAANPIIGLRAYGDNPQITRQMASNAISGMAKYNVVGCAKHFPGHGDTATDSHYGLPCVDKSLEQLRECELKPFRIAIDQGVEMIMTAHILYPQLEQETAVLRQLYWTAESPWSGSTMRSGGSTMRSGGSSP